MAIEARIPDDLRQKTARPELDTARYEVAIGFDETQRQFEFKAEKFLLKQTGIKEPLQRLLFPMPANPPESLLTGNRPNTKTVVNSAGQGHGCRPWHYLEAVLQRSRNERGVAS